MKLFIAPARFSNGTKVLFILIAAALGQGLYLLHQKSSSPRNLQIGDAVPWLHVEHRGVPLRLEPDHLPACTFVIFFSPTCPFSTEVVPAWSRTLAVDGAPPSVSISLANWYDTDEFALVHRLPSLVLATGSAPVADVAARVGILSVPQVVVLGDAGRVAAIGDSRADLSTLASNAGCAGETW